MITFINEELFKLDTQEVSGDNGIYYKTNVLTSCNVKRGKKDEAKKVLITKISSPTEDINSANVAVVIPKESTGNNVVIRVSERNKYDSNLMMIAIPFNGIAQPIPESKQFRIHKGVVVRSDKRNIRCNDNLYKKVLYLIVEPNVSLFDDAHKYHTDEIVLPFISYNLENKEEGSDAVTMKCTVTVKFTADNIYYDETFEECEPIEHDKFRGEMLFHVTKPATKNNSDKPHSTTNERHVKSNNNLDHMIDKFNKQTDRDNRDYYSKKKSHKRR